MSAAFDSRIADDESLSLSPKLQELHGHCITKRMEELEATIASLKAALDDAEAELEKERTRLPDIGDYVRCPLTNFFGRVTRVIPRPRGRPWVEITPYLGKDLPGHGTMDLYDSWELIDPPGDGPSGWPSTVTAEPGLPKAVGLKVLRTSEDGGQSLDDIEMSLSKLWTGLQRPRS